MEASYGKLFHLPPVEDTCGKWNQQLINKLGSLYCYFEEKNKSLPNGINIFNKKNGWMEEEEGLQPLGEYISSFLVNSYLVKNITITCYGDMSNSEDEDNGGDDDTGIITYLSPVNIVIDTIDRNYTSIINKEAISSIKTILNHPAFNKCTSLNDIKKVIPTIQNLNDRFDF